MSQSVLTYLLWFSALGSGLVAGLFFAFSAVIMTAFGRIPQEHGVAAMQAINSTILRSLFMPLFFGTALVSLVLVGAASFRLGNPGALVILAGGSIYLLGMFLCTVFFNVPLNNQLAALNPAASESATEWTRYLRVWTAWNHVRTVASTLACALYISAITAV